MECLYSLTVTAVLDRLWHQPHLLCHIYPFCRMLAPVRVVVQLTIIVRWLWSMALQNLMLNVSSFSFVPLIIFSKIVFQFYQNQDFSPFKCILTMGFKFNTCCVDGSDLNLTNIMNQDFKQLFPYTHARLWAFRNAKISIRSEDTNESRLKLCYNSYILKNCLLHV